MEKAYTRSSLCSKMLRRLAREVRQYSHLPVKYQYKGFFIKLPANHLLPSYQQAHPKYDKFLPHLANYIDQSDTVVDIGANVGDTLAGMIERNPTATYICIEPDDSFYRHLEENVKRIKESVSSSRIRTIKALVGKNISNVSLDGKGGTKHVVLNGSGGIKSMPLDEIISDAISTTVRILKSDVDGFDYDVIDSSMSVIENHKPILFFECQYDYEYQKNGYAKTLSALESAGYCDWTIFDNFGEVIVRTNNIGTVSQLMRYLWQQNIGLATRTIYYYDILAVQQKDSALIDKVLEEYN